MSLSLIEKINKVNSRLFFEKNIWIPPKSDSIRDSWIQSVWFFFWIRAWKLWNCSEILIENKTLKPSNSIISMVSPVYTYVRYIQSFLHYQQLHSHNSNFNVGIEESIGVSRFLILNGGKARWRWSDQRTVQQIPTVDGYVNNSSVLGLSIWAMMICWVCWEKVISMEMAHT